MVPPEPTTALTLRVTVSRQGTTMTHRPTKAMETLKEPPSMCMLVYIWIPLCYVEGLPLGGSLFNGLLERSTPLI